MGLIHVSCQMCSLGLTEQFTAVVFADNLDVIVEDPKTQTVNVGENVRFYCRTITAPVSIEYSCFDPALIFSGH